MVIFGNTSVGFDKTAVLTLVDQGVGVDKIALLEGGGDVAELLVNLGADIAGIVVMELRGALRQGLINSQNRR